VFVAALIVVNRFGGDQDGVGLRNSPETGTTKLTAERS